jgi:hypothetical protein
MPFPKTLDELKAAGYRFEQHATCKGEDCKATVEWWRTPRGGKMPVDVDEKGNVKSHFATCPNVNDFRR